MKETTPKRVGAIMCTKGNTAYFFGYGTLEGEAVPPAEISSLLNEMEMTNPRILLDSGKTVWGCECWWGGEEQIKSYLTNLDVVEVDIEEERLKHETP